MRIMKISNIYNLNILRTKRVRAMLSFFYASYNVKFFYIKKVTNLVTKQKNKSGAFP